MSHDYSVDILPNPHIIIIDFIPGRYMEMIEMLKPIAFDVIICMTQLFDYYLYTIYTLFACDMVRRKGK